MHIMALVDLVHSVKRRIRQGDCPTEPAQSRETLEEMVSDLWDMHQRAHMRLKILTDPDDEPMAGGSPETSAGARGA